MPSRRSFIQLTAAAGGAAALSSVAPASLRAAVGPAATAQSAHRLRILILGGTGFTGPYQVSYAVERGHHVTVFNRGRREIDLPAGVVQLQGDRNAADGLAALRNEVARGTRWDVVIDNPGIRSAAGLARALTLRKFQFNVFGRSCV